MGYNDEEYRSPRASKQYTSPKNKRKRKTKGQQLEESGEYLQDPETQDTSKPLESRMFDIDPKKHKQAGKTEKIYKKATNPQAQGSEKEWVKKTGAQLPPILESREMDEIYAKDKADNKEFDEAVARGDLKEGVRIRQAGKLLRDSWEDTKEFKHWSNLPHNIGAVGARGVESFFTIDANNPKEVALELIQKVGNPRKGLAGEIISEIPGVKVAIRQIKKEAFDFAKRILPNGYDKLRYALAGGGELTQDATKALTSQKDDIIKTKMLMSGAEEVGDLSQRMRNAYARNKKVIKEGRSLKTGTQLDFTDVTKANEKTLKKMGLWDYRSVFSVEDLDGAVTRSQAKGITTPWLPGFTKAQAERLGKIDELKSYYKNLSMDKILPELDHKNPLKLSAYLMDKTTGAKRIEIRKTILDEGIHLGEMKENMEALPREVHKIWTDNMNKYLGKTHKNFQDTFLAEMKTLGITDELDIAREYARRIKAARETFDVAFDAHKITYGSEWTNNIDDMVNKLDEAFEAGDEWAPRRTNEAISGINETLSNLDEVPFSNETAQDLIKRFNLDNVNVHTLKDLFKKPMAEQVKFLKKHTGQTIGELNDQLQHYNMTISDLLNLLDE